MDGMFVPRAVSCFTLVTVVAFVTRLVSQRELLSSVSITKKQHATTTGTTMLGENSNCEADHHTVTCSVTGSTLGGRMFPQNPRLVYGGGAKVIFLLGYPYSGTSAIHFLLSTSNNVTTLTNEHRISASEEGFTLAGLKERHSREERWDGALEWVDWEKLADAYERMWSNDKPLKVENSPPEIQAPTALKETFEPRFGKVKFLLLVRGECTLSKKPKIQSGRALVYQGVVTKYPEDTFVLRFEDICFFWDDVLRELVRWEPLLADINSNSIPQPKAAATRQLKHYHTSVNQYCESVKAKWETKHSLRRANGTSLELLQEFGYSKTITCT